MDAIRKDAEERMGKALAALERDFAKLPVRWRVEL